MSDTVATDRRPSVDESTPTGTRAFVVTIAACTASAAVSIDLMLPAFPDMRADFGLAKDSTAVVWTLTAFFLGLAFGQLVYGPLSDRFGRKPLMYVGLVIYIVSAASAALAPSLGVLIACRALWGFGAAGPRSVSVAMVRDRFAGAEMARTMSHVTAIFIVVPIVAPAVGAVLMTFAPWQIVFWLPAGLAVILLLGTLRIPETLPREVRRSISPRALGAAFRAVVTNPRVTAFAFAMMCLLGVMTGLVGSFQLVFDEVFGARDLFPVAFSFVALVSGAASVLNARMVERLGLGRSLRVVVAYSLSVGAAFAVLALATGGRPALWAFWAGLALVMPASMVLFSNSQAAAMAPVPEVAGMAAALLGAISSGGGALLGSLTASAFDGTITPFVLITLLYLVLAGGSIIFASRHGRV